jgi:oligopeptide transport system ATP-binding protein
MANLLEIRDLEVEFTTRQGAVKALRHVNLTLGEGEILGIVGESGSGKSVTMLAVMNLLAANGRVTGGSIRFDGKELSPAGLDSRQARAAHEKMMSYVRGAGIGMIFQDPMTYLNPVLRIGTQMTEGLLRHAKCSRTEARDRAVELLRKVGIPSPEKRMSQYPYELSGGMRQRVIIASALACGPKLLIADEPTTALDVTVQMQILELIKSAAREQGTAVVMITHDLGVVAELCSRIDILYAGQVVEEGTAFDIFDSPKHPYTKGLLLSAGSAAARTLRGELPSIPGAPPNLLTLSGGCAFAPRCPEAMRVCEHFAPASTALSAAHACSCWQFCRDRAEEIIREGGGAQ